MPPEGTVTAQKPQDLRAKVKAQTVDAHNPAFTAGMAAPRHGFLVLDPLSRIPLTVKDEDFRGFRAHPKLRPRSLLFDRPIKRLH